MEILFGLELELFAAVPQENPTEIVLPPKGIPVDGFPGLVELRSTPRNNIFSAVGEISGWAKYYEQRFGIALVPKHKHKFTPVQHRALRAGATYEKRQVDVRNIYGKSPRDLRGTTIASLQINISKRLTQEYRDRDKGTLVPATYGIVDVNKAVRFLDSVFADAIKESGRQPGEYAIKDGVRLEYRSAPNYAIDLDKQLFFIQENMHKNV